MPVELSEETGQAGSLSHYRPCSASFALIEGGKGKLAIEMFTGDDAQRWEIVQP